MNDLAPKTLFADRYRLRKRLGKGSLWEVWLADNEMAGYQQVVKIFAPLDEPGSRAFRREFARAYHLMHPRLLRATYFDIHGHRPYLVMPYCLRGSTLKLVGKLNEGEIARVMRDVCGALAYIHQPAYQVVHRDIQPDNILLSDKGEYLLSDSGISSELREAFHRYAAEMDIPLSSGAGMLPSAYRAPECFIEGEKGKELMASDIWALGATLFELATGYLPFGPQGGEGQLSGRPLPDLPAPFSWSLSNILKHCMAKDPWARPSAENLAQMAEDYLNKGQWPAKYFNDDGRGWKARQWARIRNPLLKRAALGAAFFTAVLAIAALLALPRINNGREIAENEYVTPDVNLLPTDTLSTEKNEFLDTLLEVKEGIRTAENMDAADSVHRAPSESSPIGALANPASKEPQRLSGQQTKKPTVENKGTSPRPTPKPEQTTENGKPNKPKRQTESGPQTKGQQIEPKFNDLTGTWGYIDKKGTWIIWPQFEEAAPFQDGKAKVAKRGSDGSLGYYYLNPEGRLILISKKDTIKDTND